MTAPTRYRRRPAAKRKPRHEGTLLAAAVLALILAITAVRYARQHPGVTVLAAVLLLLVAAVVAWLKLRHHHARRMRLHTVAAYHQLTPTEFEHALADLCRRDGCRQVEVVGGAGDLGADVLLTTPDGRRMLIQAKRYARGNAVGSPEVQKVGGTYAVIHRAHLAAVVTTSHFTPAAIGYARQARIRLMDEQALAAWASRTGPAPWH
jgi:restriction system protein